MNEHIVEYLEYYVKLVNPQYAVLLIGNWGCGKTYFIKKLLDDWKETENSDDKVLLNPIYISLNGIANINSINEKIRATISPILYSKGMKVVKSISKSVLKAVAKIDLDDDSSISFQIDPLSIFNSSKDQVKGKKILIFDDIERCKINTDEIFGYINDFVEHSGCKVILVTDEEKIEAKYKNREGDKGSKYTEFKEKLIGQTFEVKSDIKTAVKHFIKESGNNKSKFDLNDFENLIIKLFIASKLENLRVLKQALLDFNRLTTFIDQNLEEHENYEEFIKNLITIFIIVYAEFKTGNDKIKKFQSFKSIFNKKDNESAVIENKYESILTKYKIFHSSHIISVDSILKYIEKGHLPKSELNQELESNVFFRQYKTQDWELLWEWNSLEDDYFKELCNKVWKQFHDGEIKSIPILLHIVGIFISLIDKNLLNKNKKYVVTKAKQIINSYYKDESTPIKHLISQWTKWEHSYQKGYQSRDTPEFKELKNYIEEKVSETQLSYTKNYLKKLFEEVTEDSVYKLNSKLKETTPESGEYYERTAIFKNINGKKVGRRIKSFKTKVIDEFYWFLHTRYYPEETYSNAKLEEYHKNEVKFLEDLKVELGKNMKSREKIKNLVLNDFINKLEAIIIKINNI